MSQKTDWTSTKALIRELLPQDVTPSRETLDAILDMLRRRNDDLESYESVPRKSLISKVYFFRPEDKLFEMPADHGLLEVRTVDRLYHSYEYISEVRFSKTKNVINFSTAVFRYKNSQFLEITLQH